MVEWRRSLGNVYTTLAASIIFGLSLWLTLLAPLSPDCTDQGCLNLSDRLHTPLVLLMITLACIVVLRILGVPLLAIRGLALNIMLTLIVVGLLIVTSLFAMKGMDSTQNFTAVNGGSSRPSKQPTQTFFAVYITCAVSTGAALIWRLFGGSF
jgi:hypothetical protein